MENCFKTIWGWSGELRLCANTKTTTTKRRLPFKKKVRCTLAKRFFVKKFAFVQ